MGKNASPIERRFASWEDVDLRQVSNGLLQFRGHAAVYGRLTTIANEFREQVAPTAFNKTLEDGADVRFLINHDPNRLGARTKSGTLRLENDSLGLGTLADLDPRQTYIRDLQIAMERGDLDGMSFAFLVPRGKDSWEMKPEDGGLPIRTINEARLFDVSAVTFPAYEMTDAELVSVRALYDGRPDLREMLHEAKDSETQVSPDEGRVENAEPEVAEPEPSRDEHSLHSLPIALLRRMNDLRQKEITLKRR